MDMAAAVTLQTYLTSNPLDLADYYLQINCCVFYKSKLDDLLSMLRCWTVLFAETAMLNSGRVRIGAMFLGDRGSINAISSAYCKMYA
jgi:hypothetical protein